MTTNGIHNKSSLIGKMFFVNLSCKFAGGCRLIGPEEIRGRLLIIYPLLTSIGLKIRKKLCLTKKVCLSRRMAVAYRNSSFFIVCRFVLLQPTSSYTPRRAGVCCFWTVINIRTNLCSTTPLLLSLHNLM